MRKLVAVLVLFGVLVPCSSFADEKAEARKELCEILKFYVGNWSVTGTLGDEPYEGKASFRMPAGKHCILGTVSMKTKEGPQHFSLVSGWDSSTGWSTEQGIESTGEVYTVHWRKVTANQEKGDGTGTLDGKKTSSKIDLERKGQVEVVVKVTERKVGNESLPDLTIVYHRVQPTRRDRKAGK